MVKKNSTSDSCGDKSAAIKPDSFAAKHVDTSSTSSKMPASVSVQKNSDLPGKTTAVDKTDKQVAPEIKQQDTSGSNNKKSANKKNVLSQSSPQIRHKGDNTAGQTVHSAHHRRHKHRSK